LQIIRIIFDKSGAFYGLAAILNVSAILNYKEHQQEFLFFYLLKSLNELAQHL
jgi:hypothetical protein